MEYRLLTFLSVCEDMNFTRAADRLHITQPAVSQQIHWLEEEYGAPLFCHEGKRLRLSQAGQLLREAAVTMKNDEDVLRRRMRDTSRETRSLRLGATRTIASFGVAKALARYLRLYPEIDLDLSVENTEELLKKLRQGQVQCALVEGYFDPAQFDWALYRTEDFIAVCAAGHRFEKAPRRVRDLAGERLLVREEGSGTREILTKLLSLENMKVTDFAHLTQVGSMEVILELAAQDLGVSFLYEMAARQLIREGRLRPIPLDGLPLKRELALVWEKGSRYGGEYRALCRSLAEP